MRTHRNAWNKGRLLGQMPPLKLKEIWSLRIRLQLADKARDLALFNLAIDSKLRGCDLISLRIRDVYQGGVVASRAIVMQRKTQRPVQFEITEATRDAVTVWVADAVGVLLGENYASNAAGSTNQRPAIIRNALHATTSLLCLRTNQAIEVLEEKTCCLASVWLASETRGASGSGADVTQNTSEALTGYKQGPKWRRYALCREPFDCLLIRRID